MPKINNNHLILWAASLSFFVLVLDSTVVSVALPSIGSDTHGSISSLQWIADVYLLVLAASLLLTGFLSDKYGAKRVFLLGVLAFTVMSVLCSLANSLELLIGARLLQGFGAALIMPSSLSLIRQAFAHPQERTKAIATWASVGGVAVAAGPVIGGILTQAISWRTIFLINLPVGIVTLFLVYRSQSNNSPIDRAHPFDKVGLVTSTLAMVLLTYGLIEAGANGWGKVIIWLTFGGAIIAGACFIHYERKNATPMIPLELFGRPLFSAMNGVGFVTNFCLYGLIFILSLLFQQVMHFSVLAAGLLFLPLSATVAISNFVAGRLSVRYGHRASLLLGQSLLLLGLGLLAIMYSGKMSLHALLMVLPLLGIGGGLTVPPMTSLLIESAPTYQAGIASGILSTARQLGSVVGIALFGAMLTSADHFESGMRTILCLCTLLVALALAITIRAVRLMPRQKSE
jgi:MFS transporter, DHA2 family, methylenomycin A resistance protein